MANDTISNHNLRILFVTQDDPFYIRIFFDEFLKEYANNVTILGAVICPTMGKKTLYKMAKQMLDFYGIRDFWRMVWRFVAIKFKKNTLENLFNAYHIEIFKPNNINSTDFLNYWSCKHVDVIVSIAAPVIFKDKLLNLPRWGCLNIHHAKLPFYRGMMPNFWQMYHKEKSTGVTVHRMNNKIDEGEIILQRDIPMEHNESLDVLIKRTKRFGAHCIIEALDKIKNNTVTYMPNHPQEGSYFTFPSKNNVQEFRRRGYKIL